LWDAYPREGRLARGQIVTIRWPDDHEPARSAFQDGAASIHAAASRVQHAGVQYFGDAKPAAIPRLLRPHLRDIQFPRRSNRLVTTATSILSPATGKNELAAATAFAAASHAAPTVSVATVKHARWSRRPPRTLNSADQQ
jgi:hypothetical protein